MNLASYSHWTITLPLVADRIGGRRRPAASTGAIERLRAPVQTSSLSISVSVYVSLGVSVFCSERNCDLSSRSVQYISVTLFRFTPWAYTTFWAHAVIKTMRYDTCRLRKRAVYLSMYKSLSLYLLMYLSLLLFLSLWQLSVQTSCWTLSASTTTGYDIAISLRHNYATVNNRKVFPESYEGPQCGTDLRCLHPDTGLHYETTGRGLG